MGREVQEGGVMCILMADLRCITEINKTLYSNYPPIKNKFLKIEAVFTTESDQRIVYNLGISRTVLGDAHISTAGKITNIEFTLLL